MTFRADPDAEYHLSVSNRHEICHGSTSSRTDGIRTYHNNFETLLYTLPSKSFIEEEKNNKANSSMNIHRFFILETMPPKDLLSCESSEDEKNYPKIDGS